MPLTSADATPDRLRADAQAIWAAGVAAVRPEFLTAEAVAAFPAEWRASFEAAPRLLVVGAGKAGAGMAAGLEAALPDAVGRMTGVVNVPEGVTAPLRRIRLHAARPAGSNHPTAAGIAGAEEMLRLLAAAGPDDVAVCLLSGGGSALLPAPARGVTLDEKQLVTRQLHACGAAIAEMNAVRKHLSRVKGGRLAAAFRGRLLVSLIISDVVGDPLDVIASGPTAPDPTTAADALGVLDRYALTARVPAGVLRHLEEIVRGAAPETPADLPDHVHNLLIGTNATALTAAAVRAAVLGYRVVNLGPFVEGEAREVGVVAAGLVQSIRRGGTPVGPPACVLIGGETTVTLGPTPRPGRAEPRVRPGGRPQARVRRLGRGGGPKWRHGRRRRPDGRGRGGGHGGHDPAGVGTRVEPCRLSGPARQLPVLRARRWAPPHRPHGHERGRRANTPRPVSGVRW